MVYQKISTFSQKSVENVNTRSETFKRNIFALQSSSNYDTRINIKHKHLTKQVKAFYTKHTNIAEAYNAVMEDIMLSEYVWIYFDSKWHPVTVLYKHIVKKDISK